MIVTILYTLLGLISLAHLTDYHLALQDDPKEPTRLRSKIPLIGHLIGIITSGPSYHSVIRNDETTEIYTLAILNFKLYTSVSTRILPLIQRQSKALSFRPMIQTVARKWGDSNNETDRLFGGTNLTTEFSHAMKTSLAPGPGLDEMNLRMAERALIDLDLLLSNSQNKKIKLLEWARFAITQASSCGVYGNQHPFLDPAVYQAFWVWHGHLSAHITGLNFFSRVRYSAREIVFEAHEKYCSSTPPDTSSLFTSRWNCLLSAGLTVPEAIKQQATLPIRMLSNTIPTFFWTVYEIFSRPSLLAQIRDEILSNAVTSREDGSFELDVAKLKTECPVLLSTSQETQRTRHIHAAIRKVMTDTLLDDKYLLKAGNYLQMPGHAIHSSTKIYGPTAKVFDPHRFIKPETKRSGADFLAWGAPPHLCPARQFAAVEILILVGLLVVRAEIEPSTQWEEQPELDFNDPVTVLNPKRDVEVEVKVRKGWEGEGRWRVKTGESKTRVGLASG